MFHVLSRWFQAFGVLLPSRLVPLNLDNITRDLLIHYATFGKVHARGISDTVPFWPSWATEGASVYLNHRWGNAVNDFTHLHLFSNKGAQLKKSSST